MESMVLKLILMLVRNTLGPPSLSEPIAYAFRLIAILNSVFKDIYQLLLHPHCPPIHLPSIPSAPLLHWPEISAHLKNCPEMPEI